MPPLDGMLPLFDAAAVRDADARAIAAGTPGEVLMETAGLRAARVIAGHDDDLREIVIQTGARVIDNPAAEEGMSQSIVQGVSQTSNSAGWLIALGDMPWVAESTVRQLLAEAQPELIVVPSYQQRDGNPVLFGAQYASQLVALSGDRGAKSILQAADSRVIRIATEDQGVLHDVDTPADLVNQVERRNTR